MFFQKLIFWAIVFGNITNILFIFDFIKQAKDILGFANNTLDLAKLGVGFTILICGLVEIGIPAMQEFDPYNLF